MATNPYSYLDDQELSTTYQSPWGQAGFGGIAGESYSNATGQSGLGAWTPPTLTPPDLTRPEPTAPTWGQPTPGGTIDAVDPGAPENPAVGYQPWGPQGGGSSPAWSLGFPVFGAPSTEGGASDNGTRFSAWKQSMLGMTGMPSGNAAITPDMAEYWTDPGNAEAISNWANVMLPMQQFYQNAYQYDTDSGEANRRWDAQTAWQQQLESYNADLATRQQQMNEWQQQEASGQWNRQFEWQKQGDLVAQEIANREIALAEEKTGRQLSLDERAQVWQESYQSSMLQIQQQQVENDALAARYAAFGRSMAPSAFVANWS